MSWSQFVSLLGSFPLECDFYSFHRRFEVIKLLLYKRFFKLEKKQLLRIKVRRFLNEIQKVNEVVYLLIIIV